MKDEDVVTTTVGRVKEAAGLCPDADRVLRKVFPGAFEAEVKYQGGDIVRLVGDSWGRKGRALGVIVSEKGDGWHNVLTLPELEKDTWHPNRFILVHRPSLK